MPQDIFWEFSIAQIGSYFKKYVEHEKQKITREATFNYILADLIGSSVGRLISKKSKFPEIHKVYPSLFEEEIVKDAVEEAKQRAKTEASIARMYKFAHAHNRKWDAKTENGKR